MNQTSFVQFYMTSVSAFPPREFATSLAIANQENLFWATVYICRWQEINNKQQNASAEWDSTVYIKVYPCSDLQLALGRQSVHWYIKVQWDPATEIITWTARWCSSSVAIFFTPDKGGCICSCPCSFVCLFVCEQDYSKRRGWIWMKCCVSTDVGTRTNWLSFYSPEQDCFLRYHMCCNTEYYYVRKIPPIGIGLQRRVVLKWFYGPLLQRRVVLFTASRGTTLSEVHVLYRVPF